MQTDAVSVFFEQPRKVTIFSHSSPDGDALGSSLGLYHFLKRKGHTVEVLVPDNYPDFLKWLPGNDNVKIFDEDQALSASIIEQSDAFFFLDFNALQRIGAMGQLVKGKNAFKVLIDHHQDPQPIADVIFSDVTASSTAELVYDFIEQMGGKAEIDLQTAICLYTGILTDTASFRFSSTSPKTMRTAAHLMELGVDNALVYQNIYENTRSERLNLLGFALSKKLQVFVEHETAIISLSAKELLQFDYQTGDTEGLVNYALAVKGINFAVLFIEREGYVKLSLRSRGDFAVNQIAKTHYRGGGHRNASGGISFKPLGKTVKEFIERLPQFVSELKSN